MALEGHRGGNHEQLEKFLQEEPVQAMLFRPYDPFPFATSQTKSAFDTRTAAINITPGANSRYDIGQLKEDALWLSKEAKLDEVSALRIAILEYQSRSRLQLLCDFSPEETASLQEASGNTNTETSNLVPQLLLTGVQTSAEAQIPFESQQRRRVRLLGIYLSERRHILRCAHVLIHATTCSQDWDGKEGEVGTSLKHSIGQAILENIGEGASRFDKFVASCTNALDKKFACTRTGSGWIEGDDLQYMLEVEWFTNQIIEMTLIMELMLWVLEFEKSGRSRTEVFAVSSASIVLAWFKLIEKYGFFDEVDCVSATMQPNDICY